MTFTEAALLVLRLAGKPLHYKEITDVAIEKSLLSHVGKSPEVTMGARLAAQVKNADKSNPLKRVKPGVFALSDWDDKTIEKGLEDRTPAHVLVTKAEEEQGVRVQDLAGKSAEASEDTDAEAPAVSAEPVDGETRVVPDEDEQHRAELSAGASEIFATEDDDDQPIFAEPEAESEKVEADDKSDGKRRRRRRRGRGRREEESTTDEDGDDLPGYTVSDAEPEEVLSVQQEVTSSLETSNGPSPLGFADALAEVLDKHGPARGGVPVQSLSDSLRRKLKSDVPINGATLVAVAVADNLARERRGQAPRFRPAGNHIALTEWGSDRKFADKSDELARVVDQMQKLLLRNLSEELRRLSQRAVGDLVLVLLERMGVESISAIKRAGAHGSELHLSGVSTQSGAIRIPLAIVVRRDGRDIGREKVTELRGALHHYGSPSAGWLITTGQVLSGAKEEAQTQFATPVTLTGRSELAELFLMYGVGVRAHRVEVPVLDVALFEGLSGRS